MTKSGESSRWKASPAGEPASFGRGGGAPVARAVLSPADKRGRRITIGRAIESYVEAQAAKGYAPDTLRATRNLASAFLRASGLRDAAPLVEVTREIAERTLRRFATRYGSGTVCLYASKLVAMFRAFAAAGLLLENPFAWLGRPPLPRLPVGTTLTREEMARLLAAPRVDLPSGVRHRTMLEVLYSTGLRLRECAGLDVRDVDLVHGTAHIHSGKGGKDRVVPLGKSAVAWLRRYLRDVRPRFAARDETALWVGQEGRRVAPVWIRVALRRLARKARIAKHVTPHTLRRTCATHLLQGGASVWVVKELLGHSDTKTLGRYLRIEPHELKKVHQERHPRG